MLAYLEAGLDFSPKCAIIQIFEKLNAIYSLTTLSRRSIVSTSSVSKAAVTSVDCAALWNSDEDTLRPPGSGIHLRFGRTKTACERLRGLKRIWRNMAINKMASSPAYMNDPNHRVYNITFQSELEADSCRSSQLILMATPSQLGTSTRGPVVGVRHLFIPFEFQTPRRYLSSVYFSG